MYPRKELFSIYLPYCIKQEEDGRYVILNRDYKPIGFHTDELIRYRDFPILLDANITPRMASMISRNGDPNISSINLYDDGCYPAKNTAAMNAYFRRFGAFLKMVKPRHRK